MIEPIIASAGAKPVDPDNWIMWPKDGETLFDMGPSYIEGETILTSPGTDGNGSSIAPRASFMTVDYNGRTASGLRYFDGTSYQLGSYTVGQNARYFCYVDYARYIVKFGLTTYDIEWILKIDTNHYSGFDRINGVLELDDGGIVVAGFGRGEDMKYQGCFWCFNPDGSQRWRRWTSEELTAYSHSSFALSGDNIYFVTGDTAPSDSSSVLICLSASNGTVKWSREHRPSSVASTTQNSVGNVFIDSGGDVVYITRKRKDDGYVFDAGSSSSEAKFYIIKHTASGSLIYRREVYVPWVINSESQPRIEEDPISGNYVINLHSFVASFASPAYLVNGILSVAPSTSTRDYDTGVFVFCVDKNDGVPLQGSARFIFFGEDEGETSPTISGYHLSWTAFDNQGYQVIGNYGAGFILKTSQVFPMEEGIYNGRLACLAGQETIEYSGASVGSYYTVTINNTTSFPRNYTQTFVDTVATGAAIEEVSYNLNKMSL